MYYFKIGRMECHCDTADELREICGESRLSRVGATSPTEAATKEAGTTEAATTGLHTSIARRVFPEQDDIAALPFVEGGLSWTIVKKYGKKLGRDDLRQLRSDLKKRQKMGR